MEKEEQLDFQDRFVARPRAAALLSATVIAGLPAVAVSQTTASAGRAPERHPGRRCRRPAPSGAAPMRCACRKKAAIEITDGDLVSGRRSGPLPRLELSVKPCSSTPGVQINRARPRAATPPSTCAAACPANTPA
ncbi:hypothetical protein ACRAWD_01025 [Caulobacter segnis]